MIINPEITIVSPIYMAEAIVEELVSELKKTLGGLNVSYEIILVDDRSPDNSWGVMQKVASNNKEVKTIRLSKNFGQHPAIMAGLSQARGEWVVVMDCDLQDQPKEIVKLFNKAKEGYDVVLAKRIARKDSFFKRKSSEVFYKVFNFLAGVELNKEVANFGIYKSPVINEILKLNDYIKSFPLFVSWVGFNQTSIPIEHAERSEGVSSYTYLKLFVLALNIIISFSNKPLKLFVKFGLFVSLISFLLGLKIIYSYFLGDVIVLGYSSVVVSIWFLSGVIITTIGIVGIYLGKVFDQVKGRPPYIIDKIVNNYAK